MFLNQWGGRAIGEAWADQMDKRERVCPRSHALLDIQGDGKTNMAFDDMTMISFFLHPAYRWSKGTWRYAVGF
jgi:hypothetical protein